MNVKHLPSSANVNNQQMNRSNHFHNAKINTKRKKSQIWKIIFSNKNRGLQYT